MNTFFTKAQNSILSAAFILFVSSGLGAILGIFKNRLLAGKFGVSDDLAIFYTADRIPNLVYSILILGALSTVFIPIFTDELKHNKKNAFLAASTLINTIFVFFFLLSFLTWVFSAQIIRFLGVGHFDLPQVALGSQMMKIMLVSQMLLVAGSLISSILQSYKRFLIPAVAPVVYNLGMIFGILFLSDKYGILGPAYGTVVGAAFHLLIQIPFVKPLGFEFSFGLNLKNSAFVKMLRLTPPRIVSVLITNALATINNSFAILISTQAVVYLKFGLQLQSFPVTLFGASIAAASLPTLSAESHEKDFTQFKKTFLTSFFHMLFLVLPASAILLVLRVPVVRLVYGVSNFPWEATLATAQILGVFTFSIFPQSANYLLSRAFYALKDTTTPVKISLVTIVLNVLLSLLFIKVFGWGVWSVAVSFAITSVLDTIWLLVSLSKKVGGFGLKAMLWPFAKITFAAALMAVTLYVPIKLLDQVIFDTTRTINLIFLTGIAGFCGGAVYLWFTHLLNIPEIDLLYKVVRRLNLTKPEIEGSDISGPQ